MQGDIVEANRRILVIDDDRSIHDDIRAILGTGFEATTRLRAGESASVIDAAVQPEFHIDSAFEGEEGVTLARRAAEASRPYAMAFVDARVPPGGNGIETAAKIWAHDPAVQIVLCIGQSDYSGREIRRKLARTDRLVILRKPFDGIEVLQLADALTEKWRLAREEERRVQDLEQQLNERNRARALRPKAPPAARAGQAQQDTRQADLQRRDMLARDLQRALRDNELSLHYQPLVDIATRQVVSLEALLRWWHPQLGAVSPAEFIPIAEASGMIVPLGDFVLTAACEQIVRWERERAPVVPVAVNLSVIQLEQLDVLAWVREVLRRTGMHPQRLALELTESVFMTNARRHVSALEALRHAGVRIQIDDFGTGYSSLSCLKTLPIDTVKIDRSFIRQIDTSSTDEAIVSAILAMARSLGMRAVAEGVETPGQIAALVRHGCEVAQGFYFSRPLPASECCELLSDLTRRSSFTDTLRMKVHHKSPGAPQLAIVGSRSSSAGIAG